MNCPKVSIITSSYNQGHFIEKTILSVLKQNCPNIEHIVIDGGSTDNTLEILEKYPHLVWLSEPDKGQADAVNKGLKIATGEIIGWLNSDDVYLENAVSTAVKMFKEYPNVSVVYGDCYYIDEKDQVIRKFISGEFNLTRLLNCGYCYIPPMSTFIKSKVFDKLEGPVNTNLKYCMDYDLFIRIAKAGFKFQYIPEFLSNFRRSQSNTTTVNISKMRKESFEVSKRYGGGTFTLYVGYLVTKIYLVFPKVTDFIRRIRYRISLIK
ncbi:glycosyltransferase [bacterium]|nr:glycosyltransferase [bacterium]MBU3930501.1 glycosyltransferase [bacterium]